MTTSSSEPRTQRSGSPVPRCGRRPRRYLLSQSWSFSSRIWIDQAVEVEKVRVGAETVANKEAATAATIAAERDRLAEINKLYQQQVLIECRRIVSGRYPFTEGSDNDLPLFDFARLFVSAASWTAFSDLSRAIRRHDESTVALAAWWFMSEVLPAEMLRVFQNAAGRARGVFPRRCEGPWHAVQRQAARFRPERRDSFPPHEGCRLIRRSSHGRRMDSNGQAKRAPSSCSSTGGIRRQ